MKIGIAINTHIWSRCWKQVKTVSVLLMLALATAAISSPLRAEDRKIERRVSPIYPELAKRMRVSGLVKVSATVAADGSVTDAKAVSGNRMLAPAAEDAVKRWKFASGPSESTVDIEVNFQPAD